MDYPEGAFYDRCAFPPDRLSAMSLENSDAAQAGSEATPNEARELAREKAKAIREKHRRSDSRRRFLFIGAGLVALVAVVAIIASSLIASIPNSTADPRNTSGSGILVGVGPSAPPTSSPAPKLATESRASAAASAAVSIVVYTDYLCAGCGEFDRANDEQMRTWLESGAASLEVHPVSLLNSRSQGTQYSTRAANAAACVVDHSPDQFFDFHAALFVDQPEESTAGLTDEQLLERAVDAGVEAADAVGDCIRDERFKSWVNAGTENALQGPLPGSDVRQLVDTPTVLVNGVQYSGAPGDAASFAAFVLEAAGHAFSAEDTATPTPAPTTPAATPTPTPTRKPKG
jgi:protein-disulfide isomerase